MPPLAAQSYSYFISSRRAAVPNTTRSRESPSHFLSSCRTRLAVPGTTCSSGRSSRATQVPSGRTAELPALAELP